MVSAVIPTVSSGPNVRQKIAPANAALINSMRLRDPRLMRQSTPTSGQTVTTSQTLPPGNMYNHKSISESNGPRKLNLFALSERNELQSCSFPFQLGPFHELTTTTL